ncbi:MAG: NADH-quinone oxidoreductase subunit C [Acidimicrobiia bacterium]
MGEQLNTGSDKPTRIRDDTVTRGEDSIARAVSEVPGARFVGTEDLPVVVVDALGWPHLARRLKEEGFEMLVDLCGVDYLEYPEGAVSIGSAVRFEVVAHVLSISQKQRLRVRIPLVGAEPVCRSVTDVWPGADWYEREAFDMFGIRFDGHPDLCRILMPDDWEGHPLRKDYPAGSISVQFKESPRPGLPTQFRLRTEPVESGMQPEEESDRRGLGQF